MIHKRLLAAFIIILFMVSGCGTSARYTNIAFYYSYNEMSFGSDDQAIGYEERIIHADSLDYDVIMAEYLEGPQSADLKSPFPKDTEIISIIVDQQIAYIVMSDNFSDLTGIELTLACACISLTTEKITGCAQVQISTENTMLDNRKTITINTNELSFLEA